MAATPTTPTHDWTIPPDHALPTPPTRKGIDYCSAVDPLPPPPPLPPPLPPCLDELDGHSSSPTSEGYGEDLDTTLIDETEDEVEGGGEGEGEGGRGGEGEEGEDRDTRVIRTPFRRAAVEDDAEAFCGARPPSRRLFDEEQEEVMVTTRARGTHT